MANRRSRLWLRWTVATALAELVGLGATFMVIGFLVSTIDTRTVEGISPTIFFGMDWAFEMEALWSILIVSGALLIAGMVVGAIQGAFLVAIASEEVKPNAC
ncbi:MAG: hypothetical protein N2651_08040 [Fimbriimonadales bacterium]|nr:hypothetical protein [Fimbriimonadales bacterium]